MITDLFPLWVDCVGIPSLRAGLVVVALVLIQSVFRRHISTLANARLCLLLHAGLVLPVSIPSPLSFQNWILASNYSRPSAFENRVFAPDTSGKQAPAFVATSGPRPRPLIQELPPSPSSGATAMVESSTTDSSRMKEPGIIQFPDHPKVQPSSPKPRIPSLLQRITIQLLCIGLWLTGAIGLAAFSVLGSYCILRRCKQCVPIRDARILDLLEESRQRIGLTRHVELRTAGWVRSPFLTGLLNPVILLPEHMTTTLAQDQLRFVLLHELSHVRRSDVFWNCVSLMLQSIHWFNPLVWIGMSRFRHFREMVCDRMTLEASAPDSAQAYGSTILALLERDQTQVAGGIAIGADSGRLRKRIEGIANFGRHAPSPMTAMISASLIILVCLTDSNAMQKLNGAIKPSADGTAQSVLNLEERPGDTEAGQVEPGNRLRWGGFVTDESGRALENIHVSIHPMRFPSNNLSHSIFSYVHGQLDPGPLARTDASGRWQAPRFESDVSGVVIELSRPNGATTSFRCISTNSPGFQALETDLNWDSLVQGTSVITMPEGHSVHGRVEDPRGQPIAGAAVREGTGLKIRHRATAITDSKGRFSFPNRTQYELLLTAQAPGFAMISRKVKVEADGPEIRFVLTPARPVNIQIIDASGAPVRDAHIRSSQPSPTARDFRNPEQVHDLRLVADADGRLDLPEVPADGMSLIVSSKSLNVERVFRIQPGRSIVVLRLVPAKEDAVRIRGILKPSHSSPSIQQMEVSYRLAQGPTFAIVGEFRDDRFEITIPRFYLEKASIVMPFQVRVQVPGKAPWLSKWCHYNQGDQELQVDIQEKQPVNGHVLLPDGNPASGADIRMIEGNSDLEMARAFNRQFTIRNNEATGLKSDKTGAFTLPDPGTASHILILHDKGHLQVPINELTTNNVPLKLVAWGTLEGQLGDVLPEHLHGTCKVSLRGQWSGTSEWPVIPDTLMQRALYASTQLEPGGRFTFTGLFPGRYVVSLTIDPTTPEVSSPTFTSHARVVDVVPGMRTFVTFGEGNMGELQLDAVQFEAPTDIIFIESANPSSSTLRMDRFVNWETYLEQSWKNLDHRLVESRRHLLNQSSERLFVGKGIPPGEYNLYRRVVNLEAAKPGHPLHSDIKLGSVTLPPGDNGKSPTIMHLGR